MKIKEKMTDFGFSYVKKSKKNSMIEDIFNNVSYKYDLMNDIMSFGVHRIWKNILVYCNSTNPDQKILDLASGTGDITKRLSKLINKKGFIVSLDINRKMLKICRKKIRNSGTIRNIFYIQANSEYLPFKKNIFDSVIVSFGFRNFTEKKKQ
ncbi:ubiE [Wigglesworthia glossinidia endosymbiont of Glossina brevipalpis]|nr:ubiE [Wigglesworthia glossinidia endosymbiont of Glossina brevipalpis]